MSNTVKLPTCPKCHAPIPAAAPQGLCPRCVLLGAATATETGVPATATSEIPSLERIAAAFPQLEVLELIGRGGMGFVFKARQPHLDRFVALKLLPDKLARDAQFAERFNREGRVLAKLNHPNITSVFDFGHASASSPAGGSGSQTPEPIPHPHPGFYYLLMEYVDGVNLRQAMRAGRFSPAEALALVPKVCEALQYAHEQGILHRDIKPENILLDTKGRVKIADFGIAKLVGEDLGNVTLTNTGASLGTPHYMAPEQFEKPGTVDHRADIYSLGVVFYEMLTGELPIGRFAAPSSKTPVNSTVDDVVFRTLEKDRERRFQSAGEMRTQVEHLGHFPGAAPGASSEAGIHGEQTVMPLAPRWVKPVAITFIAIGATAVPPTLISLGTTKFDLNLFMLLALTGVALLKRNPALRRAALVVNSIGLLLPWLTVCNVAAAMQHGTLAFNWRPTFAGLEVSLGLAVVFALLETSAWAAALWTLLRSDVEKLFTVAPRARVAYSQWSIYGAISVGLSLPVPLSMVVSILAGRSGITPSDLWFALSIATMPALGGTLLGWLGLNEIRESRGRVRGLPLAMFATLFWPLTIFGALTVGVPMFWAVPGGEPTTAFMIGRFLVLLLPAAVIAFGFWGIHATARWAGQQQVVQQRGLLKWVFILVLLIGVGVVLLTNPGQHRAGSPTLPSLSSETVGSTTEDLGSPRKLELHIPTLENDAYRSLMVTTDSELPVGDYLVGLLQRPDGQIEEHPVSTIAYSGEGRSRVMRHILWSMGQFESNRIREIALGMKSSLDGRVVELAPERRVPVFSVTNDQGGVVAGFLTLRSQPLPATGSLPVSVSIVDVPERWPFFLSVKLRVSAPLGYMPLAVGVLADGSELETHTSISGDGGSDASCYWYYPREFQASDVQEIIRQLVATKGTSPNGIKVLPGERVPVFAVTNQGGTVFRGYFEMRKSAAGPAPAASAKPGISTKDRAGERGVSRPSVPIGTPAKPADVTGSPRKIELRTYEHAGYRSLSITSDSELPAGEHLVGLMERPDGRMEERPATTTIYAGGERTRVHRHLLWSMGQFESNRVREIAAGLRAAMNGRVIDLAPEDHAPVFSATNDQGGVVAGFITLRSQPLTAADHPSATVTIVDASVASQFFLSARLRINSIPGYFPNAVGLMGDGSELQTHTSVSGGGQVGASTRDSCYWYFPKEFQANDLQEIVRQLVATKVTSPNGITVLPGERVPVFAVTNQAGTIFRGFFELPPLSATK